MSDFGEGYNLGRVSRPLTVMLLIYACNLPLISQTYFSGSIGFDIAELKSADNFQSFQIVDKGFGKVSPVLGLKADQYVFDNIFLTFGTSYTKKFVHVTELFNIAPATSLTFNYIRTNLVLNINVNHYYFGVGGGFNIIKFIKYTKANKERKGQYIGDLKEGGLRFSAGVIFGRFDLELYYYQGLTPLEYPNQYFYTKPVKTIGILASYSLKLFGKPDGKRVECPRF